MGEKILHRIIVILSVLGVLYHFVYVRVLIQAPDLHANTHLGFGLVMTFLLMIRKNRRFWPLKLLLVLLSLACVLYVQINYEDLLYRLSFNTTADLVVGATLVVICLIACWEAAGPVLPILAIVFILYAFFGYLIPGPLQVALQSRAPPVQPNADLL